MAALDLDLDLGVDLDVVDAPQPATAPTATDTGFLIHSTTQPGSPTDVELVRSSAEAGAGYEGEVGLLAQVDAFFGAGGSRLYISPLGLGEVAAADLFGDQLGPGQLMAPEVVAQTDMIGLRDWAW